MRWPDKLRLRLRTLLLRRRVEEDLDEELRSHLEQQIEENVASGMTPEEARYAALRAMGGLERIREQCRDERRMSWIESAAGDVRHALRVLRKSPGFTVPAIITLALSIGANTTTFSALNAFVFRPLPVSDPEELFAVETGHRSTSPNMSIPDYRDFRVRNRSLASLMAYRVTVMSFGQPGGSARVWGYLATGNYFDGLGVGAWRGRVFHAEDDGAPGSNPVVVLSYGCWERRFASDPAIVGKQVKINGLDFTILGVMPKGFYGTERFFLPEVWIPMSMEPQIEPGNNWLEARQTRNSWILGRLKPGVSVKQAEQDLNLVARGIEREYPKLREGWRVRLTTPGLVGDLLRGPVTGFSTILFAIAALVLLTACLNLAGLLVARASDRRREIAMRLALGAGRGRILRQLLTESLVLAVMGGISGLLLAVWLTRAIAAMPLPVDISVNANFNMDGRVLAFAAGISLLASLLFGLAPALESVRQQLVPAIKNEPITGRLRGWHLRDLLVTAQIALSVVLLLASVLVARSLRNALTLDIGFEPRHAASVGFDLGLAGYPEEPGREFQRSVLARVSQLPGVDSAGLTNSLPLSINVSRSGVAIVGKPAPRPGEMASAIVYQTSPGYFRAMRTRLVAGRDFDERDQKGSTLVAIVNQTFANRLLPGEEAVGRRFTFGTSGRPKEIVGVVETGKYETLGEDPKPAVFLPLAQDYNTTTVVVARSARLGEEELARLLRQTVLEMDPSLALFSARSLESGLGYALFPAQVAALVIGAFGVLILVLAATGVYGVTAYAVARRTREIGIRMALGARPGRVLRLCLRRTALLLTVGTGLGALASLAVGQLLSSILYGASPRDPVAVATAILLMAFIALAASVAPARRAMRVDPATTLREE
jgi:predicted permease